MVTVVMAVESGWWWLATIEKKFQTTSPKFFSLPSPFIFRILNVNNRNQI
jgi:hypothetical protein